jgi:hypothetical protein
MLHLSIALLLLMHGVGHAVGFWMPVPIRFTVTWLLPGIGFLVGSWPAGSAPTGGRRSFWARQSSRCYSCSRPGH